MHGVVEDGHDAVDDRHDAEDYYAEVNFAIAITTCCQLDLKWHFELLCHREG